MFLKVEGKIRKKESKFGREWLLVKERLVKDLFDEGEERGNSVKDVWGCIGKGSGMKGC